MNKNISTKSEAKKFAPVGMLQVGDLKLSPESFDIGLGERLVQISGPTCTICSDCCLCETGGV